MELDIIKINPTENMTILVKSHVERTLQSKIAEQLMDYGHTYAEQVGYIEPANHPKALARLQMMGGEFCANATLSLAAYLFSEKKKPVGDSESLTLEVSGSDELIQCYVTAQPDSFLGRIKMPEPLSIDTLTLDIIGLKLSLQRVTLAGINHYIFPQQPIIDFICEHNNYSFLKESFTNQGTNCLDVYTNIIKIYAVKALEQIKKIDMAAAFGLLFHDVAAQSIIPLIYVKNTNSLIWEKSCMSGTSAVAYLEKSRNTNLKEINYLQPGGTVKAQFTEQQELYLQATIKIVLEGKAYL